MTSVQPSDRLDTLADQLPGWGPLRIAIFVFFVAFACYLPLPISTPIAATEGHRGLTAHQMVQSGEWLLPRLFDKTYLAKPPLHYWIIATCETILGRGGPFVWRLPSAIEGALLAALLSLFASRWFGRLGGLIGGVAYVGILSLWGEDRGADIDVSNSLFSTLTALCLIEIHIGAGRRRWPFAILAGIAIGASFLVKGPCGLPVILGSFAFCAMAAVRRVGWRWLVGLSTWLPFLIGAAIFGAYAFACYRYLVSHHLPLDLTGVNEGTQDLHPHDWSVRRALEWIFLAPTMFVFALPVSLALPLSFNKEIRGDQEQPGQAAIVKALAWTVIFSWVFCFVSGMHLPRYAFVTLPLLAALAGAVGASVPRLPRHGRESFRWILFGLVVALALAGVIMNVMQLKHADAWPIPLAGMGLTALIMAGIVYYLVGVRTWRAAWAVPALLLTLSIPFASIGHYSRLQRCCVTQGQWIRSIAGDKARLVTCAMVLDQPDIFYYAGLPTHATNDDLLDWRQVPLGTWVVLEPQELAVWKKQVPEWLRRIESFNANGNPGYLIWYADPPAATSPAMRENK